MKQHGRWREQEVTMAEYTLNAIKSAAIKSTAPDTNFSSDSTNRAYFNRPGSEPIYECENVVFAFDTSLIKKKKLLLSGQKLKLYITAKSTNSYEPNTRISFWFYNADWTENTLTWNNAATKFSSGEGSSVYKPYLDIVVGLIE